MVYSASFESLKNTNQTSTLSVGYEFRLGSIYNGCRSASVRLQHIHKNVLNKNYTVKYFSFKIKCCKRDPDFKFICFRLTLNKLHCGNIQRRQADKDDISSRWSGLNWIRINVIYIILYEP